MGIVAKIIRSIAKLRFRLLGLATITDIPTDEFRRLAKALTLEGWKVRSEYKGFDAWIDYGRIRLRKRFAKLSLEWDNWTEGSVEGPRKIIEQIANRHGYEVSNQWRWSIYDEEHQA